MKTLQRILVLVMTLLAPQITQAQGNLNLIVNGGFDTDASGWTLSNGSVFSSTFGHLGGNVRLGDPAPTSSIEPTASQIINSLNVGITYQVSGDYLNQTHGQGSPSDLSFGVAIDGIFLFETAAQPIKDNWRNFNFFYTATSTNAVLSLSAQINGTLITYGIDNIAMYAVPEPSTWMLLMAGAVLLLVKKSGLRCRKPL